MISVDFFSSWTSRIRSQADGGIAQHFGRQMIRVKATVGQFSVDAT